MIHIQNVCGKVILICLIPLLVGVIMTLSAEGLAPINEVKHIRFNIVHHYQDCV